MNGRAAAQATLDAMRRAVYCVTPTGDSDGFTQRFYYTIAAGCVPVRVDSYYPRKSFGRVAWPFKQTIDWRRAVVLLPPDRLRTDGLMPTLANISKETLSAMQARNLRVTRPSASSICRPRWHFILTNDAFVTIMHYDYIMLFFVRITSRRTCDRTYCSTTEGARPTPSPRS